MKNSTTRYLFLFVLCISSFFLQAQETAVTEGGDTVYLYSNGMWTYEKQDPEDVILEDDFSLFDSYAVLDSSNTVYKTPKENKKKIANDKKPYSLAYDADVWNRVPNATINEEADYTFMSKKEDKYAMIIYEEVEIGLRAIMNIAMSNVKDNIGVDPEIIHSDYVMVNGKQMIHATYGVKIQDLNFIFDSFYYSGSEGTYQFTTWTFANIHEKGQDDLLNLLSGITIK